MSPLLDSTALDADLDIALADAGVSVTVSIRDETGTTVDPSTGSAGEPTVDSELTALKGLHTAAEMAASGGLLRVGDVWFLFKASDLPDGLKTTDYLTHGGLEYEIVMVEPDEIGATIVASARKA